MLPVAASIAIMRYHLYDIDLVASRTVSYAAVTGVLSVAYAVVVILLGSVLSTPLPTAVAALCVAVAFRPLRDRIQDVVDRRFRRARYETRRTMADFVDGLRSGTASIEDLEPTLRAAGGDPDVGGVRAGRYCTTSGAAGRSGAGPGPAHHPGRDERLYRRDGMPCPRCGTIIVQRGQWEDNRATYWCPGCQR